MTWPAAEAIARAGGLVRAIYWPDRWLRHDGRGLWFLRVMEADRQTIAGERVPLASDFGPEEFAAEWTTEPLPLDPDVPLATVTARTVFSAAMVSFGEWPAGLYRIRYDQGAFYYVAANKSQLRINAYNTSTNGFRVNSTGIVDLINDARAPGDGFRYAINDPRTESQLLEDIARRNAGETIPYEHPGGSIYLYLGDDYTNNGTAAVMPQFSLLQGL